MIVTRATWRGADSDGHQVYRSDNTCFCIQLNYSITFKKTLLKLWLLPKKLISINKVNSKNLARLSCKIVYSQDKLKFIIKATFIQNELYPYTLLKGQTSWINPAAYLNYKITWFNMKIRNCLQISDSNKLQYTMHTGVIQSNKLSYKTKIF